MEDNDCSTSNANVTTAQGLTLKEPLQSQASSLEILILDSSPKLIRKQLTALSLEEKKLVFSANSNSKIDTTDRHTFERYKPPMVKQKSFPTQPRVYEEIDVQKDDDSYDSDGYENIPKYKRPEDAANTDPTWISKSSSTTKQPPIPPARRKHLGSVKSTSKMSTRSSTTTPMRKLSAPINFCTDDSKSSPTTEESFLSSRGNASIPPVSTINPKRYNSSSVLSSTKVTDSHGSKEENLAYLKTLSLNNILQLLDNMNLAQYKERFTEERIDGEILLHLDRGDLVELGVTKTIHQTRLLKLVDGSMSARKFQ